MHLLITFLFCYAMARFPYDHMNTTYYAKFEPFNSTKYECGVNLFFSPDNSIQPIVELIEQAKETIDIEIPYLAGFKNCKKSGCTASDLREKESFPIFTSLVNKVHEGVKVRLITNDNENTFPEGTMDQVTFLQVAGAEIRQFTSLPYLHAKLIIVDGRWVSIGSINFSTTSFLHNREQGIIIDDEKNGEIVKYVQEVFDYDFEKGYVKTLQEYSKEDIEICKNKTHIDVVLPDIPEFDCNVATEKPEMVYEQYDLSVWISPDYAFDIVMEDLDKVKEEVFIFLYSIEPDNMCDKIIDIYKKGIKTNVFVSNEVFSKYETEHDYLCYKKLFENDIIVKKTKEKCLTYSHNKFWCSDKKDCSSSNGNWEDIDFPSPPYIFPPYWDEKNYRRVQRDFHIRIMNNEKIYEKFMKVFDEDFKQGHDFKP